MPDWVCDLCGKNFSRKQHLQNHSLIHSGIKAFECDICQKKFYTKDKLNKHSKIHKPKETGKFECETCGRTFSNIKSLTKHSPIHSAIREFKCDTCEKAFTNKRNLQVHSEIHSGIKPYSCDTCGMTFLHKHSLQIHEMYHKGIKNFKCDTCGKAFFKSNSLKGHLLSHAGIKKFECGTCGKAFMQKEYLQQHLKTHVELECDICGKIFNGKVNLYNHKQTHRGLENFKCGTCGKCANKNTFILHSEKHSKTNMFTCAECNGKFMNLKKHQSGNFPCEKCGEQCCSALVLSRHTCVCTSYKCTLCEETFAVKDHLDFHVSNVHFEVKSGFAVPINDFAPGEVKTEPLDVAARNEVIDILEFDVSNIKQEDDLLLTEISNP